MIEKWIVYMFVCLEDNRVKKGYLFGKSCCERPAIVVRRITSGNQRPKKTNTSHSPHFHEVFLSSLTHQNR